MVRADEILRNVPAVLDRPAGRRPRCDLDDVPETGRKLNARFRRDVELLKRTDKYREAIRAYVATITYVDALLGQLLDAAEARADADNTVILLWSDHGWHFGEKGQWHKFTLWERATRVPLLVCAPGLTAPGSVCAEPVNLVDLYPTLSELCHLPPRPELDGVSIVPQLKDPATPAATPTRRSVPSGPRRSRPASRSGAVAVREQHDPARSHRAEHRRTATRCSLNDHWLWPTPRCVSLKA